MKKNTIKFRQGQTKKSTTPSTTIDASALPTGQVVSMDPNSEKLTTALGLSEDRAAELEKDVAEACTRVCNGEALTLNQCIAIGVAHCETPAEVAYITALITDGWNNHNLSNVVTNIDANEGTDYASKLNDGVAEEEAQMRNMDSDGGFDAFLAAMFGGAGAAAFAGDDDDDSSSDDDSDDDDI